MTAQGNALRNKNVTMTNALKGRNKMFNPTNGGRSFALSGLTRFVSYGSQGVALGLSVTAPLGQIVRSSSGSNPAGCVTDPESQRGRLGGIHSRGIGSSRFKSDVFVEDAQKKSGAAVDVELLVNAA